MSRNLSLHSTILFILVLLFLSIIQLPAQGVTYTDTANHWAVKSIYRASAIDLMSGYPGNQFKPEQPISRLELLVVLMKSTGYANKLAATRNNTFWGQKYIDKALQEKLITTQEAADLVLDQPADRVWTAVLLYRMLHLPTANSANCTDISTLTSVEQQVISSVIANSLMSVNSSNYFQPRDTVSRAQTAVIISNLLDKGWLKLPSEQRLVGWISKINSKGNNKELELTCPSSIKSYRLDPQVHCFINNTIFTPNSLLNTKSEILLNNKKQVTFVSYIESYSPGHDSDNIIGTIKNVVIGTDNQLVLSDLDCEERVLPLSDFVIARDEKGKIPSSNLSKLKANTFVRATLNGGRVTQVETLKVFTLSGTILRKDGHRIYLSAQSSGKNRPEWFNYYDRARVVDSKGIKSGNPLRGDKVKVTYLDPDPNGIDEELALEIMISSRPAYRKVTGVVQSISLSADNPQIVLSKNKTYLIDTSLRTSFPSTSKDDKIEFMVDGADVIMQVIKITPPTVKTSS